MSKTKPIIAKNQDVNGFKGDDLSLLTFGVGGAAGDGIMSAGKLFSQMMTRNGFYAQYYTEYPSLIRGGHNAVYIRVSEDPVHTQVTYIDILFALNLETIELHIDEIPKGGSIIYDPRILRRKSIEDFNRPDISWREMPLRKMSMELNAAKVIRNTIGMAGAFAMVKLPLHEFQEILQEKFSNKPSIAEINVKAAEMGYQYMLENHPEFDITLEDGEDEGLMMITGNAATAAGFIAGGIGLYTGYPMSPATSLLETMVNYSKDYNFMTVQAEDEISAVTMAIGGNHTGMRAATGTSGGGVSLMTEAIGLAASAEIPLVVVNVMRPGPSTGMPTWTSQGDLLFTIRLGQDSFPRIVLAPGDVEECYKLAIEALNYAEEYQVPVIFLTDKWLGTSGFTSKPFENDGLTIRTGKTYDLDDSPDIEEYKRFEITDDGISKRAIPGQPKQMIFKTTGNEHNEAGQVDDTGPNRIMQMDKRMRKMNKIIENFPDPKIYGVKPSESDVTIISWGSNKGIIQDSIKRLEGIDASFVHVSHIWPFPRDFIKKTIEESKITILAEQNYEAQFGQLIRSECLVDVDHKILRYDGSPFDPIQLADTIRDIVNN